MAPMSNEKTPEQKPPEPSPTDVNNFDDADKLPNTAPGPDGPPPDYPGAGTPNPDLVKKILEP
jgi:hypothetical protein